MGKFFCNCLNVHICIKCTDVQSTEPFASDSSSADEFFSAKLTEVQLSLEGVQFEHPYLVKTRQVGDWTLHKCMSCECTTHATHNLPGSGKVLISTDQLSDELAAESLRKSSDFCSLYKIIIPSRNDNEKVRSLGVQSEKYESLQKTLGEIQQQLNTFLVHEEATMEDRIKSYMDSQRTAYAELQSKVRRHKNTMVNLVLLCEQRQITESLSDAMTDSPTSPLSPSHVISSEDLTGSEAEATQPASQSKRQSAFGRAFEDVPTVKAKKLPSLSERLKMGSAFQHPAQEPKVTSSVDPDGDLDFDSAFQDDNNQPFYTSDEETEDTDDSESELRGRRTTKESSLYSASVPISVPMWGRSMKKSFAEDFDEEDLPPQDAASMAASIKALAQSVHGDGTEMFGELPRPRLNTSNFAVP